MEDTEQTRFRSQTDGQTNRWPDKVKSAYRLSVWLKQGYNKFGYVKLKVSSAVNDFEKHLSDQTIFSKMANEFLQHLTATE